MNEHIEKLIEIARSEIGTREDQKNNTGVRVVEYQGATWLAPGAWPWCAAFTAWIMREWLEDEKVRETLGFTSFSLAEKWRCRDASAFGWEKWAKQQGIALLPETEKARAGDFVVYDFSHIGLVIKDQVSAKNKIITIEGNTNKKDEKGVKDSESGDGVWDKERVPSLAKSYIRIFS